MSAPVVRPMTADDLPRVVAIDRAVGWPHTEERFRYLLEDEETRGFVAERAGEVAGFAFAGVREPVGWLGAVAVAPEQQGHGVGTAVCAAADAFLRAQCDSAILEASPANAPAIAMYQRLGFVVTGETACCSRDRETASPTVPPGARPAGYEVAPVTATAWPALCALDDTYYGGWREQDLLYWLSEGQEFARILWIDGQPSGYCLFEQATGRFGPAAAPTPAGFLALLDDVLASVLDRELPARYLWLRLVDPDAAALAGLAARNLQVAPDRRQVRMEKVYRRPARRLQGYYLSARPEKG